MVNKINPDHGNLAWASLIWVAIADRYVRLVGSGTIHDPQFFQRTEADPMTTRTRDVKVTRVYDSPNDADGVRVLVDRVWPRGLSKQRARVDEWCKAVAPSTGLRKWYGHDPQRFAEFNRRYRAELAEPDAAAAVRHLRDIARHGPLTLLTATKSADISQAAVLADLLRHGS